MVADVAQRLVACLRDPGRMAALSAADWTDLMQRARPRALLGKLAAGAERAGIGASLPPAVQRQFASVLRLCAYNEAHLKSEAFLLLHALRDVETPVVFLKGGAYALLGLRVSEGRVSSDVDVLVARDRLDPVERALDRAGWFSLKPDPYDQHYYRTWMHELPPIQHRHRATVMDVHHTILPLTGRIRPDAEALMQGALPVSVQGRPAWVLQPADMVVHAAVHLFQDGDLAERLRELVDIHELVTEFSGEDSDFWARLAARAAMHQSGRPLAHALRFSRSMLGTAVPEGFIEGLPGRPRAISRAVMSLLVPAALVPSHPAGPAWGAVWARRLLFLRSHWLRMPPGLLLRHLAVKGWAGLRGRLRWD
jgi:hypothetical protein